MVDISSLPFVGDVLQVLPLPVVIVSSLVLVFVAFCLVARRGGPQAPPLVSDSKFPILGTVVEFLKSPNDMMTRCVQDYGSIFTIPIFHQRMTFLIGPEAQSLFYTASDDTLSQDECYHFMTAVFGPDVVFDAPRKKRHVQFTTMTKGLRTIRMKTYVSKIQQETVQYCQKHWGNATKSGIDLYKALSELTILTASRCLHGEDVREYMFEELQHLYHDLDEGLTPLTVLWSQAPTPAHAKRNAARKSLVELFGKVIQGRKENPQRSDGTDILSLFMDIVYKDGSKITTEEVTGLLIALLFAGQHTSCTTSTWTTLFLVHQAGCLERVMQEQTSLIGDDFNAEKDELTLDHIQGMEYLHNSVREALRLCPTFIMLLRKAMKDIPLTVGGKTHVIPKNDLVVVSPTVSMRLESTFPNPNVFDPDRFAAPREEHKQPYAYLGFGGGMHSCMGQVFAFCQVKTILTVIFNLYDVKMEATQMPDIGYNDMVVGPKGNCNVTVTKKKRN